VSTILPGAIHCLRSTTSLDDSMSARTGFGITHQERRRVFLLSEWATARLGTAQAESKHSLVSENGSLRSDSVGARMKEPTAFPHRKREING
jgi:hypothetical protein